MSREKGSLKELEQRKKRIEAELNQIHHNLDYSVNKVRDSIISKIDPSDRIRKHPFKSFGIALVAGFILGLPKIRNKSSNTNVNRRPGSPGLTTLMLDEFKRIAARRAVHFVMDNLDRASSGKETEEREHQEEL